MIVSDIAGTTRDAIDTAIKHEGQRIYFIDTADCEEKIRSRKLNWRDSLLFVL